MMSVSSLNTKIKSLLEATFLHITVEGEVASVTYHNSGHIYFSIKDKESSVKSVMWRSTATKLKFELKKGEHIVVDGSIGVYTPRGEYQLIATKVEPYGKGALALAFEQLKQKLKAKGYFESVRRKSIPKYISKIAIITSSTGAALQDMLKVAKKRWNAVEIVIIDVLVQGEQSSFEIAQGIEYADSLGTDIIVLARGGGSSEDLWAFNEERVADSIFEAVTPVVSAVGHEVDMLISDMVADLRAPTPSAAMEMILPDGDEVLMILNEQEERLKHRIMQILLSQRQEVSSLLEELSRSSIPNRLFVTNKQFENVKNELNTAMGHRLNQLEALTIPHTNRMQEIINFVMIDKSRSLEAILSRLSLLDSSKQIHESWAQVNKDGKKIPLVEIEVGDEFDLVDNSVKLRVRSLKKTPL
ncbi:MAG: exodeoxyribonuclease VII large subunit [Sulfurovum sp.]|nr:exodeoxyribonuclease VII large subunit [Sulfurovum sp.]